MNLVPSWKALVASVVLVVPATRANAQQAVTVSGHVTSGGGPVIGAHVRILSLKIDRTTDADGYYSFIVGSSNVRGQTVRVSVVASDRRVKYAPAFADITLAGVPITQDFDLKITSGERPTTAEPEPTSRRSGLESSAATGAPADTLALGELAGAVDLTSALVGRFPGLSVTEPGVLGGSPLAIYRGPRSILGTSQPLVVVDGVPVDNTVFTSSAQRFGLGGFDYGSPLGDIDLSTVASIQFLPGAQAAARFGGRAANGVLLITSKDGVDGPGFAISASQQITSESHGRLPVFQNQYAQGLNGKYQFFDGRGGGINDAIDQNWGPRIDGSPVSQASLTEAGVADVRLLTAHPSNVTDYFATGRTLNTTAAVQGSADAGSFRASFGNRDTKGLTPLNTLNRKDGAFHGTFRPQESTMVSAWISGGQTTNTNAPGTGLNQSNPVAEFTRMGRQVDAEALRTHLIDASGKQISWNYAGQNNPYFAALENSNVSERNHVTGGGAVSMTLNPWLSATVRGGSDYLRDTRTLNIHSGWMGGFPFYAAPNGGDFSKGGFEGDQIWAQQTNATARLDATRTLSPGKRWTIGAGADIESARYRIHSIGVDSVANLPSAGAPDTATVPLATNWSAHSRTNAAFGETGLSFANSGYVHASVRNEWSSIVPAQHSTEIYPAIDASIDLVRAMASLHDQKLLASAVVRGGWSGTAAELSPYTIETMYFGRAPSGAIAPVGAAGLVPDSNLTPERTNAFQIGTDLTLFGRRTQVGLTLYHEQTSDVILPLANSVLHTVTAANSATITNSGVEGQITTRFGDGDSWLGWEFSGNAAHNSNSVDKLYGTSGAIAMSPSTLGITVMAREGSPLGVLMGQRLLRDPSTHALLLRNGLPLPDSAAGQQQLGLAQPDWVVGLRGSVRFRWLSLTARADGHVGGSIFSVTNLSGSYAGSLAETGFRPDSGLLIAGLDAVTKKANTQHVSTEDYYHALGGIAEPWVYSATYFKIRELRLAVAIPTNGFASLPFSGITAAVVARNVYLHAKAPNIDPETLLSPYQFSGVEMGQLPATKSVGVQISITP